MMSSTEDWYPLAPKDLQSSSDDDPQENPVKSPGEPFADECSSSEDDNVGTPTILEARVTSSPASDDVLHGSAFVGATQDPLVSGSKQLESNIPICFDDDSPDHESYSTGNAQERWQRTDAYMRDVQSAFRTRPAVRVQKADRYNKILLVGEPGLGKDVFIKNAFASYCADNNLSVNSCTPDTDLLTFSHNSADFCTEVNVEVDEGRTKIHYMVQDTPGTHLPGAERCILQHVLRQSQEYMAKEEDPRRVVPLSALPDPRIDVCLFFLSPHFLKPQDVTLMTKLSEFVPVVPIIAKADALTTEELNAYRQQIRERLSNVSLQVGRPVMHNFSPADLQAAGAFRELPPFAVITSSEVDHEVGSHWFTRTFPWGRCEVLSSNHSDLPALKSLLFEHCFESLKAATEARFYSTRESHLTARALSKALSSGELPEPSKAAGLDSNKASSSARQPVRSPKQLSQNSFPRLPIAKYTSTARAKAARSRWGWGWGLGLTLGVVSFAILIQIASLGIYARNTAHLKNLVDSYQREAAAEKQVLNELKETLTRAVDERQTAATTPVGLANSQAWRGFVDSFKTQSAVAAEKLRAASCASAQKASQAARSAWDSLNSAGQDRNVSLAKFLQADFLSVEFFRSSDFGAAARLGEQIGAALKPRISQATERIASFSVRESQRVLLACSRTAASLRGRSSSSWQAFQQQPLASGFRKRALSVARSVADASRKGTSAIALRMRGGWAAQKAAWQDTSSRIEVASGRVLWHGKKAGKRLHKHSKAAIKKANKALRKLAGKVHFQLKSRANRRGRRLSRWLLRVLSGAAALR